MVIALRTINRIAPKGLKDMTNRIDTSYFYCHCGAYSDTGTIVIFVRFVV